MVCHGDFNVKKNLHLWIRFRFNRRIGLWCQNVFNFFQTESFDIKNCMSFLEELTSFVFESPNFENIGRCGFFLFHWTCQFSNDGRICGTDKFDEICLIKAWYEKNKNFLKDNFPFAWKSKCVFWFIQNLKMNSNSNSTKYFQTLELYMSIIFMWFWILSRSVIAFFVKFCHASLINVWNGKIIHFLLWKSKCVFSVHSEFDKRLSNVQIFVMSFIRPLHWCSFGFLSMYDCIPSVGCVSVGKRYQKMDY